MTTTKNGKTKIVSLNMTQLTELLEKSTRTRDKAKIRTYMKVLEKQLKIKA
jgi:hypothetical protein